MQLLHLPLDNERPQIFELTAVAPPTTLICEMKFSKQPNHNACMSFDISTSAAGDIANGHGYAAYAPASNYDARRCLGFDPKNPNSRVDNLLSNLFNYKYTTVWDTVIVDLEEAQCAEAIANMTKIAQKDLIAAAKSFNVNIGSTPVIIAGGCSPQKAAPSGMVISQQVSEQLYTASMRF
eukprot:UN01526